MACTYTLPSIVVRCPPLKQYSREFSIALGDARRAIRSAAPDNPVLTALDDAFVLREQCRSYEAKQ